MKDLVVKLRSGILAMAFLLSVATVFAFPGFRQGNTGADRVEALRIAYITEKLNLTPAEAQRFWPVYNSYRDELKNVQEHFRGNGKQLSAEQQLELEQQKIDLKKKFKPQFESALGTEKLNQLYNLEREFIEKLKEIREQRMQQRNGNSSLSPARNGR